MPSLIPGFEYDVFISYRQNDNRSGWVTQFVQDLREEITATIKDPVSIYFDENPHDGVQDTHDVDKSLEGKLRCLIFVPIVSHTYCDTKSFAWNNEFLPFCRMAREDAVGLDVRLSNGNVTSRILTLQIHDLDSRDQKFFEQQAGGPLRPIEFIFRSSGVNRPLTISDSRSENLSKTLYRDQINKTANAIEAIIRGMTFAEMKELSIAPMPQPAALHAEPEGVQWFWKELLRRSVLRAALTYLIVTLLIIQTLAILAPFWKLEQETIRLSGILLAFGFPVAMLMAWLYEISPQGIIRTTSSEAFTNPYPPYRKKPLTSLPLVAVFVLALLLMAAYIINFTNPPSPKPQITIGVLAFENRSEVEKDRYIAEGLTDDIINRLIIVSQFRVSSDTKSKSSTETLVAAGVFEIAKTLDVSTLLMGSVERSGNKVIVRARLFKANSSSYIWGKTFERTVDNLVDVQTAIVQSVAEHLNVDLNDSEALRLNTKATEDPTAYDYYLRGKSFYLQYKPESNDSAIFMFKKAIDKDRNYARAWAGLGDAYSQMYRFGHEDAWNDSSMVASTTAIRLDSNLSEAYKSLANGYSAKRLYDKALPLLVKAVELNPRNESAVGNLGTNYFFRGELPEALRLQKESARINPKKFVPYYIAGWIYGRLGDYDKAEQWLLESLELDSNFAQTYELLAYVYIAKGNKAAALQLIPRLLQRQPAGYRTLEKAGLIAQFCGETDRAKAFYEESISRNPNFSSDPVAVGPVGLGQILLHEGSQVKAEILLMHTLELNMQEIKRGSQDDDPRFLISAVYSILGRKKESLEWLQKAIDAHWLDYDEIAYSPWFDAIRNDPRYREMMGALRQRLDVMRKKAD